MAERASAVRVSRLGGFLLQNTVIVACSASGGTAIAKSASSTAAGCSPCHCHRSERSRSESAMGAVECRNKSCKGRTLSTRSKDLVRENELRVALTKAVDPTNSGEPLARDMSTSPTRTSCLFWRQLRRQGFVFRWPKISAIQTTGLEHAPFLLFSFAVIAFRAPTLFDCCDHAPQCTNLPMHRHLPATPPESFIVTLGSSPWSRRGDDGPLAFPAAGRSAFPAPATSASILAASLSRKVAMMACSRGMAKETKNH